MRKTKKEDMNKITDNLNEVYDDFTDGLDEEYQYEIAEAVLITEALRQIEEDKKNVTYRTYTLEEILEEFEFEYAGKEA